MDAIRAPTQACVKCPRDGGKLLIAGNGGSAGDSRHIAGEFQSRLNFDRAPL
jgi:D-sedoheptulose 7-phosphate isomerase